MKIHFFDQVKIWKFLNWSHGNCISTSASCREIKNVSYLISNLLSFLIHILFTNGSSFCLESLVAVGSVLPPGLNFSAQNDVRVGLQWEDFLGKCSSKLLRLFGLHWASKGGKMV